MMTRTDIHLDAMLRHLGAAYYDSLPADPATVQVVVRNGRVILTGTTSEAGEDELVAVAMRLIWDVDGVVDVISRVNQGTGADREHEAANAAPDRGDSVRCGAP
jgi:BON domain